MTATTAKSLAPTFPSKSAADVFLRHYPKGTPPGAMFKALRPLVQKHGWPLVERQLDAYLVRTKIDFHSWPKFAAGFGSWAGGADDTLSPLTLHNAKALGLLDRK